MTDLLSGGPPDQQRRWPTVVVTILVAAALLAGLVHTLSGGRPAARPTASPTVSRTPPTLDPFPTAAAPSTPSDVTPSAVVDPGVVHPELAGVASRDPAGVNLVIGGDQLVRVGNGTAGIGTIPLRPGDSVVHVGAIGSGLLVTVANDNSMVDYGRPVSRIFLVRKGVPAKLLTTTDSAFAAFDGRSLFAIRYGITNNDSSTVSRLDLSGRLLAKHKVPGSWVVDGDTPKGLLVERLPANPDALSAVVLVDRDTFALGRQLGHAGYVVGIAGSRAVWTDSQCAASCRLVVADLATSTQRKVTTNAGFGVGGVAFSPDGQQMAIGYYGRDPAVAGGSGAGFVEVVHLADGARQRIPGVIADVKQTPDLAWTPDGRWLAIAVSITDRNYRKVGLWPASGGPVRLLSTKVPGTGNYGSLLAL